MNWCGELVQKEVSPEDTVLDLGCGIMQATLDTCPTYPPTRLQCKDLLGVDIYQPYLDFLEERGVRTMKWDIRETPLPFPDKSYDIVLLTDVLEHMPNLECVEKLVEEAERIGRKKIIVLTPNVFFRNLNAIHNPFPYCGLGENPFEEHRCLITERWLQKRGFKTFTPNNDQGRYTFAVKDLKIRVLHVWCQAGVSGTMAKYQRRLGHTADVIKRDGFDGLGIDRYYGTNLVVKSAGWRLQDKACSNPTEKMSKARKAYVLLPRPIRKIFRKLANAHRSLRFYLVLRREAKHYDILHIHSVFPAVFFVPFKKKIIEFHGDDVRHFPTKKTFIDRVFTRLFLLLASKFTTLYVSTPDLLSQVPNSRWIPNPVDTEHFTRENHASRDTALYSWNWYETPDRAKEIAVKNAWSLTVLNRVENNVIQYEKMPRFLEQFEYYIDRYNIKSLSKTALEALCLGLKVVSWNGSIVENLSKEHLPENVARQTIQIYYEKLGGKKR